MSTSYSSCTCRSGARRGLRFRSPSSSRIWRRFATGRKDSTNPHLDSSPRLRPRICRLSSAFRGQLSLCSGLVASTQPLWKRVFSRSSFIRHTTEPRCAPASASWSANLRLSTSLPGSGKANRLRIGRVPPGSDKPFQWTNPRPCFRAAAEIQHRGLAPRTPGRQAGGTSGSGASFRGMRRRLPRRSR